VTWKPTDHHEVQRPQGLNALWGIIENDPVIPRGGAILALIWHLFGTDFLSANPSAAYLASAAVAPSLALLVENQDVGRVNVMASGGRKGGLGHPRERGSSGPELSQLRSRGCHQREIKRGRATNRRCS